MGRPADAPLDVIEEFNSPPPDFDLPELQEETRKYKPSVVGMEWGAEMARDGVTLAKKGQLPDFKISLGYKTSKVMRDMYELNKMVDPMMPAMPPEYELMMMPTETRENSWKLSLMIMLPLWTGQTRAEIRAASADVEVAHASLANMRNMAEMDLLMTLSETQSFWRQINLDQNTVIPQAEQSYQAGVVSYANGKVDFMAVLDSLTTLGNARLDHYKARVDYEKSIASLEKAIGKPLFENEIKN
jgi:outer membrane protein TolC